MAQASFSSSRAVSGKEDIPVLQHPFRTFFRFARYLLPYWDKVVYILLGVFIAVPMAQMRLLIDKKIFDDVLVNELATPSERWTRLWLYVSLAASMLWVSRGLDAMRNGLGYFIEWHVTLDLRKLFYKHLHRLPVSFFQNRPIGEHMFRCMNDIQNVFLWGPGIVNMITTMIPNIFQILNTFMWQGLMVLVLNPSMFYIIFAALVPYTILNHMMTTRLKRAFYKQREQEQLVPAVLRDSIAGVETIKSYGRVRLMGRKYASQWVRTLRRIIKYDWINHLTYNFVLWLPDLMLYGTIWTYLITQFMKGDISLGTFVASWTISSQAAGPFKDLVNTIQMVRQQLVPAQRILETLDVKPAIQDLPDARPMDRVKGGITFENVDFAYDPKVPVLSNISFRVEPGQTVGIVGRSGAGKSTIINLILRLHRPDKGRVLIDNYDLDKIRIVDWQDQVAIVMQDTYIFGGDVAYNIRYGKLDASEEEIWEALRMADSDTFVRQLPHDIHTDLAEGAKLSGGQKQRLGIARAMVRKPRVLLLDEPTSSLDARTENEIWRSFEKAMSDTTALVISHRLATVRKADKILVLQAGRIVEEGTHEELVEKDGVYSSMWKEQTGQAYAEPVDPRNAKYEPSKPMEAEIKQQVAPAYAPKPALMPQLPAVPKPPIRTPDEAFAAAKKHYPRQGMALDLVCQSELTPDLTAPLKTARGQLRLLRFGVRYLAPVWHIVILFLVIAFTWSLAWSLAPWIQATIVDQAQPRQDWKLFYICLIAGWCMVIGLVPGFIMKIPDFIKNVMGWYMGIAVRTRLRLHFYRHLHRMSLRFFERRAVGEHMYRAADDIDSVVGLIVTNVPALIVYIMEFGLFMSLSAWAIGINVALVILLYLVPYFLINHLVYNWWRSIDRRARVRQQRVVATLQQGVSGIQTVKAFARQRHELRKYVATHADVFRMGILQNWVGQFYALMFGFIFSEGVLPWIKQQILRIWAYSRVIFYGIPVGRAMVIQQYSDQVTGPIQNMINMFGQIRLALIPAERILETMSVEPMLQNKPNAKKAPPISGALAFENVSFAYDERGEVLSGINFALRPGETVGVVGPSGAGKSTIAKLALRLYDPTAGQVLMDGWDISDVKMESYQDQIGTVMQETYLFGGTIRDNLLFSKPSATEAEMMEAIRGADLAEFIQSLPNGLDTNLAEGSRLSGGQRQRIGIARAILRKPRLMILDEPTASLDSTTEYEVMQTLWKVMAERTTLIISHRLALVRPVNRIIVVDSGRVVEQGTHDELLALGGVYAMLWDEQYGKGKEEVA